MFDIWGEKECRDQDQGDCMLQCMQTRMVCCRLVPGWVYCSRASRTA